MLPARLVLAAVLAFSSVLPALPAQQPAVSGLILGRVVEGLTDAPVADAKISVRGTAEPYLSRSALTDAEGNFVIFDLPAGSYGLTATKTGYWMGEFGQRRPSGRGRALPVADKGIGDVRVPLWKSAAISGIVVDESGEPVVGVRVQAMARYATGGRLFVSNTAPQSTRTDDRGQYRISSLIPGDFVVSIPASELVTAGPDIYPSVFFPGSDAAGATAVALTSGDERRGIDFQLRLTRSHRVSGRLVGIPQTAVGNVIVQLTRPDDRFLEDAAITETVTRPDGSFTLSGVAPGNYTLRVFDLSAARGGSAGGAAGVADAPVRVSNSPLSDDNTRWASMPVSVGDADVTGVSATLRPGLRIGGRVVFNGAAALPPGGYQRLLMHATSTAGRRVTGAAVRTAEVDATGQFVTVGLPPGRYFVRLVSSLPTGWALESVTLNGRDVLDEPLMLEADDVNGLVITLTDKIAEVTGVVRTNDGAIDLDATVLIFPASPSRWIDFGAEPPRMRFARGGLNGGYSVKGLPPGDYLAVAVKDELAVDWQTQPMLERLARSATRLAVTLGAKTTLDLRTSQIR